MQSISSVLTQCQDRVRVKLDVRDIASEDGNFTVHRSVHQYAFLHGQVVWSYRDVMLIAGDDG